MQGWVKLYRQVQTHWLWEEKPFSKGQAWIDLLLLVNHQERKFLMGKELVNVPRGGVVTSELKLQKRWGWTKYKVRSFLSLLEQDNMIVKKADNKKTMLIIQKYGDFQDQVSKNRPSINCQPTADRLPVNTNKKAKKDKNEKNEQKRISTAYKREAVKNGATNNYKNNHSADGVYGPCTETRRLEQIAREKGYFDNLQDDICVTF